MSFHEKKNKKEKKKGNEHKCAHAHTYTHAEGNRILKIYIHVESGIEFLVNINFVIPINRRPS